MSHDIEQARHFLTLLDETADEFTFQTFDDKKDKNPTLAKWLHGDIDTVFNELVNYNKLGAGIFVMVQAGDGSGRNIKAVNRIRCVFNENDDGITKPHPIEPQIIVESSPGKTHHYFLCDDLALSDFKPIQERLVAGHGSDSQAQDLPRVMRLPGFYHNKKEPHLVRIIHESGGQSYKRDQILKAFPPYIKEQKKPETDVKKVDEKLILELRSALLFLRSDDRKQWVRMGMALKNLGEVGRGLWLEWSSTSDKFDAEKAAKEWATFAPDTISYRSVFADAQNAGWVNTAKKTKTSEILDGYIENELMPKWLNGDELADNAKAPDFLINGILETNSNGILSGASQAFKTFCVIKMAHSVCTGNDFFGHEVFTIGKVLYICGEGHGALTRRIKAIKIVEGDFNNNLFVLEKPLGIDDEKSMAWLQESINHINPVLLIFDTFSSLATLTNENDNSEVARALKLVQKACENEKTCSLVVHHFGKDASRGSRGASAFHSNVDFEFQMERQGDSMNTLFSCKKMKDGDFFPEISLMADVVDLGLTKQDGNTTSSLVLKASTDTQLPKNQKIAYDAIKDALISNGEILPDNRIVLTDVQLRKLLSKAFISIFQNKYKAYNDLLPPLIDKDLIKTDGDFFWL